jgi:uncharacterized protein YndB with AHSA1/START domain
MRGWRAGAFLAAALVLTGAARADVADSAANGFTIKITLNVQAAPADVYRNLVHNVGEWWNAEHTFSRDAHNLSIEDRPMGCFCEKLPDGGGVRHLEVVYAAPGKALVMTGGLGPFQSMAATGSLSVQLTPASGGTKISVTYAVTGYFPSGMNTWAAPANAMLTDQFTRLKAFVERK